MIRQSLLAVTIATLAAMPAAAQEKSFAGDKIPPGQRPPPGMCRIWLDGVPAGQQPAPTDCATAVRNRPANGRVIFGDDYVRPGRDDQGVQTIAAPQTLPDMMGAVLVGQGRRTPDVRRWLGSTDYTPRFTAREGKAPLRVTWVDANGQTVQVWIDNNDDGQADIVELYQRGKLVTRYRQ
jgi:hypothetical protein